MNGTVQAQQIESDIDQSKVNITNKDPRFDNLITSHVDPSIKYYALTKDESKLLVFGFIRLLLCTLIGRTIMIPQDIILEILKFYFEAMPSFYINEALGKINYNKLEIYRESDPDILKDKTYLISQYGFKTGIHTFKVQMDILPNGSIGIGLASELQGFVQFKSSTTSYIDWAYDWAFDSKYSGYSYQIYYDNSNRYREWYYDGIYVHHYGVKKHNQKLKIKWNENDIIGLKIDCDKWELIFMINDQEIGEKVELYPDQKYFPAIAIGGNNDMKLKFVECE